MRKKTVKEHADEIKRLREKNWQVVVSAYNMWDPKKFDAEFQESRSFRDYRDMGYVWSLIRNFVLGGVIIVLVLLCYKSGIYKNGYVLNSLEK